MAQLLRAERLEDIVGHGHRPTAAARRPEFTVRGTYLATDAGLPRPVARASVHCRPAGFFSIRDGQISRIVTY